MFPGVSLSAQQNVPFHNDIPVASQGLTIPSLSDKPVEFHTAEGATLQASAFEEDISCGLL